MSSSGGGESSPPPPSSTDEVTFRRLIIAQGKKKVTKAIPKFVRKLEEVHVIALPPDQPMSVVVSLANQD
jgi:hypothetical protein